MPGRPGACLPGREAAAQLAARRRRGARRPGAVGGLDHERLDAHARRARARVVRRRRRRQRGQLGAQVALRGAAAAGAALLPDPVGVVRLPRPHRQRLQRLGLRARGAGGRLR